LDNKNPVINQMTGFLLRLRGDTALLVTRVQDHDDLGDALPWLGLDAGTGDQG
jgi:hypothetical protein